MLLLWLLMRCLVRAAHHDQADCSIEIHPNRPIAGRTVQVSEEQVGIRAGL